jgi:hypothetical protein
VALLLGAWHGMGAMAHASQPDDEAPSVQLAYTNLTAESRALDLTRELLQLRITNTGAVPVTVDLQARAISGGDETTIPIDNIRLQPAEEAMLALGPDFAPVSYEAAGSLSQLLVTGSVRDDRGRPLVGTQAPALFYLRGERGALLVHASRISSGVVGATRQRLAAGILDEPVEIDAPRESLTFGKSNAAIDDTIVDMSQGPGRLIPPIADLSPEIRGGGGGRTLSRWVRLCVVLTVSYDDVKLGEDYWTRNEYAKPAIGVLVKVTDRFGGLLFDGWAGDGVLTDGEPYDAGLGCVWIAASDFTNWTVHIFSQAMVRTNLITVFRHETQEVRSHWDVGFVNADIPGETVFAASPSAPAANALAAASFALLRHDGGLHDREYEIHIAGTNRSYYSRSDTKVHLHQDSGKFTIAHEMGHALHHRVWSAMDSDLTYTGDSLHPQCQSPAGNAHKMKSKEYNLGAFVEGFAHYYATDIWNNHSEADAVYRTHDMAIGAKWMETNCGTALYGFGNGWDWARFFWDFHTAGAGLAFDEIANVLQTVGGFTSNIGAYQRLHHVVEFEILPVGALLPRFELWADWNGIDF